MVLLLARPARGHTVLGHHAAWCPPPIGRLLLLPGSLRVRAP